MFSNVTVIVNFNVDQVARERLDKMINVLLFKLPPNTVFEGIEASRSLCVKVQPLLTFEERSIF